MVWCIGAFDKCLVFLLHYITSRSVAERINELVEPESEREVILQICEVIIMLIYTNICTFMFNA